MNYSKKTIAGFGWQTILKLAAAGIVIAKMAVLARLLTPEDFGIFALVVIALGVVEASTQTGVNITLIQSKHSLDYYRDTAWVIAIFRGFIIAFIMCLLGIALASFYNQPDLQNLIFLAATIPVVKGFINPQLVSFRKDLQFFQETLFRLVLLVIEAAMAVILALWLKSVIALICALIIGAVSEVLLSFIYFKKRPKFAYSRNKARDIFGQMGDLSIASFMNYLHENGDDFIVGKLTNPHILGLYHNAYALGHKASYDFGKSLHHGLFPVLSKFQDDTARVKRAFSRSLLVFSAIVGSASLPLFLFPDLIVRLVLGEQWLAIIPSVPWFTFAGILQSYATIGYSLLMARKLYKPMNFHIFASILFLVAFLLHLLPEGQLLGAAQAVVYSRLLTLPILVWAVIKAIRNYEKK